MADVPAAGVVLFDVTPRQLLGIAGDQLPVTLPSCARALPLRPGRVQARLRAVGAGAVDGRGVPAGDDRAPGRQLRADRGGRADRAAGGHSPRPFVLVAQQSLIDPTRAPQGSHTLWAYCHVPNGSDVDMTDAIEGQIERFAPGFGELVLARSARGPAEVEADNPNYIGGDINGGLGHLRQVLARPVLRRSPYTTPNPRIFLCSSSTPPGGGVHGMCGYHAARAVLSR